MRSRIATPIATVVVGLLIGMLVATPPGVAAARKPVHLAQKSVVKHPLAPAVSRRIASTPLTAKRALQS